MEAEANVYVEIEEEELEEAETALKKNLKQLQKLPRNAVRA